MDLRSELRFPADPATVFDMLTNEDFLARKATATKALSHRVSVARNVDSVTIELVRVMPPDVPDFVRRFVGDTIEIHQTDVWKAAGADGSRAGTIRLQLAGAPVTCTGTMALSGNRSESVVTVDAQVTASVPLIGGKIERTVLSGLEEAAQVEEQVGRDWLAQRR